ncbi:NUDIX domain-containing protein [Yinghuangia sp. ASG 101]|uniref:NUDIX hydrolase n=1 Tax=Yinghuangia sp. ASG 101 TaxID=2896848 RepID=UPI001E59AFC6|nr:NUDIX domain-containing protein [Yinghuangia sp. ASG 101]UGQ09086.1 NUDIX domain-containing protein [Yinghuangia sp. ASG 101]
MTSSGIPAFWFERARAMLNGELVPVEARRAATVVLLRRRPEGLEAYLLRRHAGMKFAAGVYAFPGGGVDPRDADHEVAWAGPTPEEWAKRLRTSPAEARAIVAAAVRETFEESGVLLAGPDTGSVVSDTTGDDWEADRAALVGRKLGLTEFLGRRGLVLRSDLLGAWSRWITPEFEEHRYDTWFFVAALPDGQRTRDVSGEADRVAWARPADALAVVKAGRFGMLPPTVETLRNMTAYEVPAEALDASAARDLAPVMARPRYEGDKLVIAWPGIPDPFGTA